MRSNLSSQTIGGVARGGNPMLGVSVNRLAACGLLIVLTLAGCGPRGATDLSLDKELARSSLAKFLDAWRAGQTSDQLAKASPPVIGRDPAWAEGVRLVAYELLGETDGGANLHARVKLTLGGKNGNAGNQNNTVNAGPSQEVVYVIGTSPVITVFRDE